MSELLHVAREFVRLSLAEPRFGPMSVRRLQDLLWYSQVWSLLVRDSNFFPDGFRAGEHGPEIPCVFDSPAWDSHLASLAGLAGESWLDEEEKAFVQAVWTHYGRLADQKADAAFWKAAWKERSERQWPEILSILLASASPSQALRDHFAKKQADGSDLIRIADIRAWGKTLPVPAPIAAHAERLKAREAEARSRIEAFGFDGDAFAAWAKQQARGDA